MSTTDDDFPTGLTERRQLGSSCIVDGGFVGGALGGCVGCGGDGDLDCALAGGCGGAVGVGCVGLVIGAGALGLVLAPTGVLQ